MIPNIVFIVARYVFLVILYVFIILVIRAIYRDLRSPVERGGEPHRRRRQPQLVLVEGSKKTDAKTKLPDDLSMGRSPACQLILDDLYVSQKHARVFRQGECMMVEDLGSTNGTYINGRRVNYPTELRNKDRIKIGKTVFEYRD